MYSISVAFSLKVHKIKKKYLQKLLRGSDGEKQIENHCLNTRFCHPSTGPIPPLSLCTCSSACLEDRHLWDTAELSTYPLEEKLTLLCTYCVPGPGLSSVHTSSHLVLHVPWAREWVTADSGFKSRLWHTPAGCPWASYLTFPHL